MALTGKFVEMDVVLDKLYRNYPFFKNIDYQDVVEWTGEAVAEFGIKATLTEKTTIIQVEEYRGKLPCDMYEMHSGGVRYVDEEGNPGNTMINAADRFFMSNMKHDPHYDFSDEKWSYKLNDNYIFTKFEKGAVEISYRGFVTDDKDRPMIPDNEMVILGVVSHIAEKLAFTKYITKKFDERRYSHVLRKAKEDKAKALSEASIPSRDEQQAFVNMWVRMIPQFNSHAFGDRYTIERERLKNHSS